MPSDGFVTANGLRLHYTDFGGSGRPTVGVHGITSAGWSFADVANGLQGVARLIAPDTRGHGDSQWSAEGAYGSDDAASDVIGLMDALGLGEVDLIGHSWGGLIALTVAARSGSRIRRLVMIDIAPSSTAKPEEVPPRPLGFDTWDEAVAHERTRNPRATDAALGNLVDRTYRPGEGGRFERKVDPTFLRRWQFRTEDHWEELGKLSQPTLLVRAAGGAAVNDEVGARIVGALKDGRLESVADTGHSIHIENPTGLVAVVKPFLEA
jgi:pimeloyl-ACP methyl ester carboxylesterase